MICLTTNVECCVDDLLLDFLWVVDYHANQITDLLLGFLKTKRNAELHFCLHPWRKTEGSAKKKEQILSCLIGLCEIHFSIRLVFFKNPTKKL